MTTTPYQWAAREPVRSIVELVIADFALENLLLREENSRLQSEVADLEADVQIRREMLSVAMAQQAQTTASLEYARSGLRSLRGSRSPQVISPASRTFAAGVARQ